MTNSLRITEKGFLCHSIHRRQLTKKNAFFIRDFIKLLIVSIQQIN